MIDLYFINKFITSINEPLNKKQTKTNGFSIIFNIITLLLALYIYNNCNESHSFELIPTILFPFFYILYNLVARQHCLTYRKNITGTKSNIQPNVESGNQPNVESGNQSGTTPIAGDSTGTGTGNQQGGAYSDTISSIGY